MLNDEIIDILGDRLSNRFEKLNIKILQELGKSIKKIGELTPSQAYKLEAILKYGGTYENIIRELSKITGITIQDMQKIFQQTAKKDYEFAKKFYDYRKINFIPYEQNLALQTQVNAITRATINDFITQTTMLGYGMVDKDGNIIYRGLRETYNELIDEAILSISQGKETFQEAMYRQIKELGNGGLKVIYPSTYIDKNGKIRHNTRRLDGVIRMNLKEGLRTLHNEMQDMLGEEFGADGVEISVHSMSAIDHEEVQGRQFSKEEYAKLNDGQDAIDYKGRTYTLDHDGKNGYRPISTLNCYHYIFAVILGVSEPEYTDKELEKIKQDNDKGFEYEGKHYSLYDGEQLLRKLELEMRKNKDMQIMGKASNNIQAIEEAQNKITQLTNKYREVLEASGLKSRLNRARVQNYRRVNIAKLKQK